MSKITRRTALAGLVAAPLMAPSMTRADTYPSKPIRMIVPFAPGGTTDLLGRIAADHLQNAWGAKVVVENKSGAGGNIGADAVAKAPPDGYTLLLGTVGTAVTNQFLYKSMPYDTATAFAPVALFGASNRTTSASSISAPSRGSVKRRKTAFRAAGTGPTSASAAANASGPLVRTTAMAAGGLPLERATIVSFTAIAIAGGR